MFDRRDFVRVCLASLVFAAGSQAVFADPASVVAVEIRDYKFTPGTLTIKPGATVRWTNAEKRTSHSVQFSEAGFHSERLFPEETWEHKFDKPGRYPYVCDPHAEMTGLIIVTE